MTVNRYRVLYVRTDIPHWRIEHGNANEIATSAEEVMRVIGRMLKEGYDAEGGDFAIFWDNCPEGFIAPDLDLIASSEAAPTH